MAGILTSTVWHETLKKVGERRSQTVYLQSIPEGFRSHDGERWFSLETETTEYLELPESQMRKLVASLQKALDLDAEREAQAQQRLDREGDDLAWLGDPQEPAPKGSTTPPPSAKPSR